MAARQRASVEEAALDLRAVFPQLVEAVRDTDITLANALEKGE